MNPTSSIEEGAIDIEFIPALICQLEFERASISIRLFQHRTWLSVGGNHLERTVMLCNESIIVHNEPLGTRWHLLPLGGITGCYLLKRSRRRCRRDRVDRIVQRERHCLLHDDLVLGHAYKLKEKSRCCNETTDRHKNSLAVKQATASLLRHRRLNTWKICVRYLGRICTSWPSEVPRESGRAI